MKQGVELGGSWLKFGQYVGKPTFRRGMGYACRNVDGEPNEIP